MNLIKEIALLLNYYECVIIPDFGGFISNYKPACYNPNTHTFDPPSKELVFNSKINHNDGLLVNQIVNSQGVDYAQANLAVSRFVDRLFAKLGQGESIQFENIGSFEFDKNGNIVFVSQGRFELSDAYGLQHFSLEPLSHKANLSVYRTRPAVSPMRNRKDALKIAASVVLLLGLSLFPLKNENLNLDTSNLNPVMIMAESAAPKSQEKLSYEDESKAETFTHQFVLVGGSFSQYENAETLQLRFKNQGYKPEIIDMKDGLYRVIVDSYSNKEAALSAMENYRTRYPSSGVWVSTR